MADPCVLALSLPKSEPVLGAGHPFSRLAVVGTRGSLTTAVAAATATSRDILQENLPRRIPCWLAGKPW